MHKEDWQKVGRWIGIAYLPIGVCVILVFVLVQWQYREVDSAKKDISAQVATSTLVR